MGAALVAVAFFNWRDDWNYRYSKWLNRTLFGTSRLGKSYGRLVEAKVTRVLYRGCSSGFLLLFGGALLILGTSLFGR
jgi:hypothetical protein